MTIEMIFSWLGQLVAAGGGGALIAFGLFRYLGKSWIENQFARNLEAARSEIALLAARKMKLHDREYIVFPEVWSKLTKAYSSVGTTLYAISSVPNFKTMSLDDINDWINHSGFSEDEKHFLLKEQDKSQAYNRIFDFRNINKAYEDFFDYSTYLQSNRIFINPEIKEKFDRIDAILKEIWIKRKMSWDGYLRLGTKDFLEDAYQKYETEAKPIMKEIEELVQQKLFPVSHV
jgi:hypothetical protein